MKNIENGSIKHLVVLIVAIAIFGMILKPLFDLVLCKFITHSEFLYSTHQYIVQPILFSCILGTTFWAVDKKQK